MEAHLVEHGAVGLVGIRKAKPSHDQAMRQRLGETGDRPWCGVPGGGREHLEQAAETRHPLLQDEHHEGRAHQRPDQHRKVDGEGGEAADGHVSADDREPAYQNEQDLEGVDNVRQQRHEPGADRGHTEARPQNRVAQLGKAPFRPSQPAKRLERVEAVVGLHGKVGKLLKRLHSPNLIAAHAPHGDLKNDKPERDGEGAVQRQGGRNLIHIIWRQG